MSFANHQLFESLEDRRLMSAGPVAYDAALGGLETPQATEMPLYQDDAWVSQPLRRQAAPSAQWVVGTWKGSAKIDVFLVVSTKVKFTMKVTSASAKSISGAVTVDGHTFKGTLPFKSNGTNQFSMSFSQGEYSGSLKGTVDPAAGKITAKISGEAEGVPFTGKVSLTKQM